MGLESGWNCHISLLSDDSADTKEETTKKRHKSVVSLVNKDELNNAPAVVTKTLSAPLEHCRPLSVSAPSAINVEMAQVKFEDEISLHSLTDDGYELENDRSQDSDLPHDDERERLFHSPKSPVSIKTPSPQRHHLVNCSECSLERSSSSSSSSSSVLLNVAGIYQFNPFHVSYGNKHKFVFTGGGSSCWDVNLSRSQSHVTESTEQSAPVAFDLSNRVGFSRTSYNLICPC